MPLKEAIAILLQSLNNAMQSLLKCHAIPITIPIASDCSQIVIFLCHCNAMIMKSPCKSSCNLHKILITNEILIIFPCTTLHTKNLQTKIIEDIKVHSLWLTLVSCNHTHQ